MPQAPSQAPDLSHLFRTNLADRLLDRVFGRGAYPEPTQFQVTTAARLLDKSLTEWDSVWHQFAEHSTTREGIPDSLLSREPGVTRAFFHAIDHLETLVDSLDRLLRLVGVLERAPELGELAGTPLPSGDERERVRQFRNRIAHGDKDIEQGRAGQGLATATLRPYAAGIELQRHRLEYANLARMLEQIHDYLRAAFQKPS
jgi:hypothetical protein